MTGTAPFPLPAAMRHALDLAREAGDAGEVPVAAVVMRNGEIVGRGTNRMRRDSDPTAHAEIVAIRDAAAMLGVSRLDGCELWVTLEPCAMCAGAIAHARIAKLWFAAEDAKGGAVLHGPRLFDQPTCHSRPEVVGGVGEAEAAALLRGFFRERRQ